MQYTSFHDFNTLITKRSLVVFQLIFLGYDNEFETKEK